MTPRRLSTLDGERWQRLLAAAPHDVRRLGPRRLAAMLAEYYPRGWLAIRVRATQEGEHARGR